MTRLVDRGAIVAAYVGIGMAVVVAVSFLLVIPIEPIYWALAIPAGLLIGYYANQRSDRRAGPVRRIAANAVFAAAVTGLTFGFLLLAVKALFFVGDNGYRDASMGGSLTCRPGADCVYQRYLADRRGADLAAAGITDVDTFTQFYWTQQLSTAGLLVAITLAGGLGGAIAYAVTRPRQPGLASASDGVQRA
jgi:hypothetical protein